MCLCMHVCRQIFILRCTHLLRTWFMALFFFVLCSVLTALSQKLLCEMFGINLWGCAKQLHFALTYWYVLETLSSVVPAHQDQWALLCYKRDVCNHPGWIPQVPSAGEYVRCLQLLHENLICFSPSVCWDCPSLRFLGLLVSCGQHALWVPLAYR